MERKSLNYKNIAVLTKPIKGKNMTIGDKVDKTIKSRKPFKVKLNDSTYDLVPLMSLFIGGNVFKNPYFEISYIESLCLRIVQEIVKKEKYTGSVIQQKEGLITQGSSTWMKCTSSVACELLDSRIGDYATILNVSLYNNPWEFSEIWRYYATYIASCYFRFLESKKTNEYDIMFTLVDMCLLSDVSSYYEDYKKGELKYNSIRGIEFILINLLKYYLLEDLVDEQTQDFLKTFINDIPLCKFLKYFEVADGDTSVDVGVKITTHGGQDYGDVLSNVYCGEYDYGNNAIKKTSDLTFTYASFIMRAVDDVFQTRINSTFSFLEHEGVTKSKNEFEVEKNSEIKKLNSTIKKLQKSIESYKFTDTKSKEIIKELRLKASNNSLNDVIRSKDSEIEELKKSLDEKDSEITKLKSKLESTQKRVDTLESREIKVNSEAEIMIRNLEEELENLDALCEYYESSLNDTTNKSFEEYKECIKDLKICVIGGPNGFEKRLELLSKNITHVNIKDCNYSYDIPQCDLIISNSSINSHSHEATARKIAKSRGIGFMRTQITNIELLAKLIYQYKLTV